MAIKDVDTWAEVQRQFEKHENSLISIHEDMNTVEEDVYRHERDMKSEVERLKQIYEKPDKTALLIASIATPTLIVWLGLLTYRVMG